MKRRRIQVATIFIAVALASFASGTAVVLASRGSARRPPGAAAGASAQALSITCRSPALGGTLPAQVYLPPGYARSSSRRYPVVYFLHGLPAAPSAYTTNAFVAGALAGSGARAIVVAPQGSRQAGSDREYLDWGPGEDWPEAVAHDLTRCVDARFDTVADRFGRALVGLSAGGYGAFNIGLRHLQTFAAVESWSGYFVATDPSGNHVLDLGSEPANSAASVPEGSGLIKQLGTWPAMLAFYVGSQDTRFLRMNEQYDDALSGNGIPHTFRVYAGGHSAALWRAQASHWLTMALTYLSAGQRRRGNGGGAVRL